MIGIQKGDEPQSLIDNAVEWTQEFLDAIANDKDPASVWARRVNEEIKQAIITETHGKCAYCEAKILHDQYGDIEHYMPKSLDPLRAFDWQNLTLACRICNVRKSSRDPHAQHIIDPYVVDPQDHLFFIGPLIAHSDQLGESTTSILSLNRPELCERRLEVLNRIAAILTNVLNSGISVAERRAIYDDFLEFELADEVQYASMARSAELALRARIQAQFAEPEPV